MSMTPLSLSFLGSQATSFRFLYDFSSGTRCVCVSPGPIFSIYKTRMTSSIPMLSIINNLLMTLYIIFLGIPLSFRSEYAEFLLDTVPYYSIQFWIHYLSWNSPTRPFLINTPYFKPVWCMHESASRSVSTLQPGWPFQPLRILSLPICNSSFGLSQFFNLAFLNTIYIPLILKLPRCAQLSHLSIHMGLSLSEP